jgi:collagenase-like PrtC family protease
MANLELSVPCNNDPETLKELFKLKKLGKNRIREVYLSGPQEYSGSGRATNEKLSLNQFLEVVDKIHSEGLRVNLVLNSTCEGSDWYSPEVLNTKMEYLGLVHKEYGVEAVTIANPIYIIEVRSRFPDIEICASVLADIDCVQRAVIYAKSGANVITPDVNINRDLKLLRQIKETTGAELKLMANEGCLYKCPFRKFHFNYISHKSKEIEPESLGFSSTCSQVTAMDPSQIMKSCWIRPEDTGKYCEITSFFKIVGRDMTKSHLIRATKAYLTESFDGDLFDILCSNLFNFSQLYGAYLDNKSLSRCGFFEKVTSCNRNCSECHYCEKLAMRLVTFGQYTREKLKDFLGQYTREQLEELVGVPGLETLRSFVQQTLSDE